MRTLRSAGLIVSLAMLCGPTTSLAQVAGTISGYVQDQGGGAMPGATVTVELAGQLVRPSTQPNRVLRPPGASARHIPGQSRDDRLRDPDAKNIEVTAGANVRLDFSLRSEG